jgi:hypothetical protein
VNQGASVIFLKFSQTGQPFPQANIV